MCCSVKRGTTKTRALPRYLNATKSTKSRLVSKRKKACLNDLPMEVLYLILQYSDIECLRAINQVSKEFYSISNEDMICKFIALPRANI